MKNATAKIRLVERDAANAEMVRRSAYDLGVLLGKDFDAVAMRTAKAIARKALRLAAQMGIAAEIVNNANGFTVNGAGFAIEVVAA